MQMLDAPKRPISKTDRPSFSFSFRTFLALTVEERRSHQGYDLYAALHLSQPSERVGSGRTEPQEGTRAGIT